MWYLALEIIVLLLFFVTWAMFRFRSNQEHSLEGNFHVMGHPPWERFFAGALHWKLLKLEAKLVNYNPGV